MKNTIQTIKQKLNSYIYIYIYIYIYRLREKRHLNSGKVNDSSRNARTDFGLKNNLRANANYIRNSRNIRVAGISASVGMIMLMTLAAFPLVNKTITAEATMGAANQSTTTLTMTSGYSSAELNLAPNANGVFSYSSDDELAKFGITTNNYTGYTLSIAGSDDTKKLTDSTTGSTLDSISSTISESVFDTNTYNGKWGYRPSKYNSTDNVGFLPAPTTTASTLDVTSSANTTDTNEYTIGLGARADMSTPAGTYTNTFILTAVGNPIVYTINYSKGDITDTVSNLPTTQSGSVSTTSVTLSSTTPTRTNYTFLYWCLGVLGNNSTTCDGATYNAGASFGIDQTIDNTTTLYAVWSPNITIKTNTGISTTTLNSTSTSTTSGTTVTGLVYGQSYTLTASNSTGYTFSSWPSLSGTSGSIANTASSSTTYTVGSVPVTITPSATINSYLQTVQVRYQNADGTWGSYSTYSDCTKNVNYNSTHSCSIAASGAYQAASLSSYTVTGTNTKQIDVYRKTFTISLSAGTGISSVSGAGTYRYGQSATIDATVTSGYEWVNWTGSSTVSSKSYTFTVTSNMSWTANGKSSCTSTISGNMQSAGTNASYCAGATGSMTDSRDNQVYTIAKLGDGKLWMTRNLAIGCAGSGSTYSATRKNASLTNTNSNVSSSYTISTSAVPNLTTNTNADDGFTKAYMQCNKTYGAWYNYKAATAGTITGSSNSTDATYDICPSGWRLPTHDEQSAITSYKDAYSPVAGGYYREGSLKGTSYGRWWSSTADNSTHRYDLYWNGSSLLTDDGNRYVGFYVRCVRSS